MTHYTRTASYKAKSRFISIILCERIWRRKKNKIKRKKDDETEYNAICNCRHVWYNIPFTNLSFLIINGSSTAASVDVVVVVVV